MFTSTVTDPQGDLWTVSLRIIPRREGIGFRERFFRRFKKRDPKKDHWYDYIDIPFVDGVDDIWVLVVVIVVLILFIFIGWPLILLLADFIWLILVLLGALITYGILGRPVTIAAVNGTRTHTWKIRGLIQARRFKQKVIHNLAHGVLIES